ncbi:Nascent polypeptide-associated complex subunit beta [Curvularia kusanoi]|uniref:Nascent polypeptide-associated complex subunit beta n=1 Tax=Curvularia kusanoi TaxID=90978 RepID=A0A9P4WE15_CURKU|nr:Nascent polypeptide-associated complex subunit beta [Curvularia kusanoi]
MLVKSVVALALAPVALAHFNLNYPASRGFDEDKEPTGPCGGFDTVSSQRTDFPINGAPIQLKLGHLQTNIAAYLAVGDNPGDGFNVVLHPQIQVSGLGDFCMGSVSIPSNLNVTDGTKATIQVITKAQGEDTSLYQCADVTLVNTALSQADYSTNCKNGTGVSVTQQGISGNPNSTSGTGTASGSGSAASPTASAHSGASQAKAASERTDFDSFESAHTQHHAESCLTTPNLGESEPRPYPKSSKPSRWNFARPLADDSATADPPTVTLPPTTANMDQAKLARMQAGKGTPRRKVKKVHRAAGTDDKKLQAALKKLNVQPIQAIEEVNMFKSDGNVIHFAAPKVHASVPANTFAIYGVGEDKELTELVPGILNQLGPDSLASLRKLAESYQSMQKEKGEGANDDEDDDDIPDLVAGDNFESAEKADNKPDVE